MSRLISSTGLRRVQTLSSTSNVPQINQGSRNISTCYRSNRNVITASTAHSVLSSSINFMRVPHRGLWCRESLGLDKVQLVREKKLELYQNNKDKYVSRLASYLDNGNNESILKDDLTNLIGLAENEQHLDLIERMIDRLKSEYNSYNTAWGTTVMRIYCTLGLVDRAYTNLKDQERFGEFFNQYTAYKIALTMLYNTGRYDHVVEIFRLARERFKPDSTWTQYPGLAIVAFAALAKMNTPTAFEEAEQLYNEVDLKEYTHKSAIRVITFLAHMAVNRDEPAKALNLISGAPGRNYVTLRELKTLSLLRLKRYADVERHLRDALSRHEHFESKSNEKPTLILLEVFELIENCLCEIDDMSTRYALTNILVQLEQSKLVGKATLESLVFATIGKPDYHYNNTYISEKRDSTNPQWQYTRTNNYNSNRYDGSHNSGTDDQRYVPRRQQRGDFGRWNPNYSSDRQQRDYRKSYSEDDSGIGSDDTNDSQRRFER